MKPNSKTGHQINLTLPLAFLLLTTGLTHAADVPITVTKSGNVSAAMYDAQGRLVRELLHAAPLTAGKQSLIGDELVRDGNALQNPSPIPLKIQSPINNAGRNAWDCDVDANFVLTGLKPLVSAAHHLTR